MDHALKRAGIEEKYFHTGEIVMNYVAGPPHGTPLVFIPGQSATWEEYTFILPKLVDRFQVFAVSLRGHGKSSWTPDRYTFNQLGVVSIKLPPEPVMKLIAGWIALQQALSPGSPVDLKFFPAPARILTRGLSQFDGNFARAFVQGTVGQGFDHAAALSRITQPILFLHANWFMHQGRLLGALDDQDVERVRSLVKGDWKYVRMHCGHAIAIAAPAEEAEEIINWGDLHILKPDK